SLSSACWTSLADQDVHRKTANTQWEGEADGHRPHRAALVQEQRKQCRRMRGNSAPPRGGSRCPRFEGPEQDAPRLQPPRVGVLPDRGEERGIRPPGQLGLVVTLTPKEAAARALPHSSPARPLSSA